MTSVNCISNKIIRSSSKQTINTISISNDNKKLVVGQDYGKPNDPTLSIFDIETGECIEVIERTENSTNSVYSVLFDKNDNEIIYYIKHKESEYLYIAHNISTKEKNVFYKSTNKNITLKLSYDNLGNLLLTDLIPKLFVFDGITIVDRKDLYLGSELKEVTELNKVIMILSPSGSELLIGNAVKGKILVYSIDKKEITHSFSGDFGYLKSLYYDQAGNCLLAIKENYQLIAWDTKMLTLYNEEKCNRMKQILSCYCNSDYGIFMFGMSTSYIDVISLETMRSIYDDDIQDGRVYDVCLSTDGTKLVSAGEGGKIVVRDIEIGVLESAR